MLRFNMLLVGLGGLAIAAVLPHHDADAQSGQALVFAERACLDYGVPPATSAFDGCVARASRAFDRGEPDLAYTQARLTRDARDACQTYGVSPEMAGYRQCVATQVDRRLRH